MNSGALNVVIGGERRWKRRSVPVLRKEADLPILFTEAEVFSSCEIY
jgi:hypothetical protein